MSGRRSLAEILGTSLKALEGLGLPHGLDHDGAANVVWLEARGLGGVTALARALDRLEPGALRVQPDLFEEDGVLILRADDASGIGLAATALDLAEAGTAVEIPDCEAPLLVVAEAARRSETGITFKVSWESETGASSAKCGGGEAALSVDLRAAHLRSTVRIRAGGKFSARDGTRTAALHARSLRDSVAVDPKSWSVLAAAAKRILVPASDQSRGGAGAEVDDSA